MHQRKCVFVSTKADLNNLLKGYYRTGSADYSVQPLSSMYLLKVRNETKGLQRHGSEEMIITDTFGMTSSSAHDARQIPLTL